MSQDTRTYAPRHAHVPRPVRPGHGNAEAREHALGAQAVFILVVVIRVVPKAGDRDGARRHRGLQVQSLSYSLAQCSPRMTAQRRVRACTSGAHADMGRPRRGGPVRRHAHEGTDAVWNAAAQPHAQTRIASSQHGGTGRGGRLGALQSHMHAVSICVAPMSADINHTHMRACTQWIHTPHTSSHHGYLCTVTDSLCNCTCIHTMVFMSSC